MYLIKPNIRFLVITKTGYQLFSNCITNMWTINTHKMETPSKQISVIDLSTTIIWVSKTSEPICIRQKTATRREPKNNQEMRTIWYRSKNPQNSMRQKEKNGTEGKTRTNSLPLLLKWSESLHIKGMRSPTSKEEVVVLFVVTIYS